MHLAFLCWYSGAGPKAHRRVVLEAANLWNKLATTDPGCQLAAHQAVVECVQMWQGGNTSCWAARLVSHLHHLDILSAATTQLWTNL